jgi:phenylacetate-CoA ligase
VEQVLMTFEEAGNNHVIHLDREGPIDQMTIRIEATSDLFSQGLEGLEGFRSRIIHALREELQVTPQVEFVEVGTIPAGEGKAQRVIDNRPTASQ